MYPAKKKYYIFNTHNRTSQKNIIIIYFVSDDIHRIDKKKFMFQIRFNFLTFLIHMW